MGTTVLRSLECILLSIAVIAGKLFMVDVTIVIITEIYGSSIPVIMITAIFTIVLVVFPYACYNH